MKKLPKSARINIRKEKNRIRGLFLPFEEETEKIKKVCQQHRHLEKKLS
ncbi:MAG: hypothetical protein PHC85_02265 [Candidatus Pacebacteria bacterium]|nr:hypothetical protein [Candidatus Paceibacterota bacterium]